ncbi:MAG: hypothetical protein R3E64_07655 [Halioglobus sp.]
MEKLLYPLWKPHSQTSDDFRDELVHQLSRELVTVHGVHGLRICAADSAVAPASKRRIESHAPLPDAMLSLWVDFAGAAGHWEPLIDACVRHKTAYLVAEAEPLVNQHAHPSKPGERVYGMCHVVFMSPPAEMKREEWLALWKDSHTQIAIDTQSTFGYRQNLVVRALGEDTPVCHAIVEENFPPEAMTSDHAFYATGGDEALLQQHMDAMMESCARFIDFQQIDVIPMSEYLIKPLARP